MTDYTKVLDDYENEYGEDETSEELRRCLDVMERNQDFLRHDRAEDIYCAARSIADDMAEEMAARLRGPE